MTKNDKNIIKRSNPLYLYTLGVFRNFNIRYIEHDGSDGSVTKAIKSKLPDSTLIWENEYTCGVCTKLEAKVLSRLMDPIEASPYVYETYDKEGRLRVVIRPLRAAIP
jgi:hypothetical protein